MKSAVPTKGTKFTNMFGNHSPKEEEENQRPTSLAELCSNVTNIHPGYKNRGAMGQMPAYHHPSLFNHLFANYHQAFYPHMMMPQKPPGGCYGHPCCGGFHAAAMHQMMHDMHHSCCQQKKQKKVEQ